MGVVAVLLINLLIAMMGNTYTKIAETKNEWQRQWARIVLVVERGIAPHDRLKKFQHYSQTMADGRAALILRLNQTVRRIVRQGMKWLNDWKSFRTTKKRR